MQSIGLMLATLALAPLGLFAIAFSETQAKMQADQVASGAAVFGAWCAGCHGAQAEGDRGPALDRPTLAGYRSGDRLLRFVRVSMPEDMPGVLSSDEYSDVVAFLLDLQGLNPDGVVIDASTAADITLID